MAAAEGLYFPGLQQQQQQQQHLEYVEETLKECSVRGCRRFLDPNVQNKMCEECRGRHRVYATTKRMRRKKEKAALEGTMGAEGIQAAAAAATITTTTTDWNHNPPETTIPGWDPTIDPMLYEVSTGTATPPAPNLQTQLTLASSSSELANALSFPARYYQEDAVASVQPPQISPTEDEVSSAGCISPAMLQGTAEEDTSVAPLPAEDPAEGNPCARYCSVKGCKAVIPGSYEYKMCPSCRTRYRAYGITKRRKWKAERQAFELEMGELRRVEEERRKASGLPLLADNPEELRAWELSILDEQIALPPQVLAALGEADGEGSSNTSTAATAPSILSLYQNDPNQPSNTVSPNDIIGPYATVIDNTPQLPARMCTVSHCHQILPGYYRFKRCEQHRLQNRHHSKLKRVREKEEKAIGPKEGAVVVEIPLGTAELRKNVGGDRLEVKAKRARKGTHCAMEGCGNALPEEKRWRHCEVCRLAERAKKKPRAAAAAAVQIEANAQPAVDALETVQVFTNTNNTNEDEENSGLAPAVSTDLDTSNSNPPINPQPQPHQQQQELHLVNITSTTFPHPSGPQLYRWTVDAAQISTSTSTSSISSTSSSSTSSSSSTGTSPTDLSQQQQQNQQPLTIKQYDPSADKEPVMRHTANYQPYVTVERFPFRDVGVGGGGASSSADTGASTTTNPSISTSASASNGESNSASARDALTAGLETTTLTFALGEDGALTGCCQYDEGVFRHYVGPPRKGGGSQVSPVVVAGAGEVERGSVESTPSTVGEAGQVPSEKGMEPLRETGVSTPELEKTSISGVKSKWGDAGTSASRQAPVKPSPPLPPPPPTTTTTHAPPPPQPPVYPYHPYYLLSPSQYAQYAAAAAAGAYSLVYPPLHPSGPVPLPVPGSVPESASTAPNAKVKGTKKKGKGAVSAPTMAVHPHTYTYPVHLPYPYSALVPGQAGAQAVYYPSVYHYPLGVGVGVSASAPPAIPVPVRTAAAAGSVSAPAGGGGVSTSASAPPQPKSQAQVEGKAEGEPTKERVHKKQREPRAVFNYYHHGYGTTDSPEVPVGVEPGKRKRRKIDPAWLEKMRLRAEEEKRVAAEAATGDAAGSTTGSGAAVEVASTHVISSSSSVDLVEPVSAISSAYASEAEVEQSLEHAQGVGRNDSGMLDNVMDEDDLHVEDTRASITEASSSRSRLSERERDYEHGSPEANNVESNLPCYNKTCRRRVVSTSTTGGSTFCERCKAKFKKHAEKSKRRHNLVPVKLVSATSVGVGALGGR